jgi:ribonuclease R
MLHDEVEAGRLVALRNRRYALTDALGETVGKFSRHPAGFGFVVPDDPHQVDLFIPPSARAGAVHGDLVAAQVVGIKPDGRREGRITRVLTTGERFLLGTFRRAGQGGVVDPLDPGFDFSVAIPKEHTAAARDAEVVRVTWSGSPQSGALARGRVLERLGFPDAPGVDIEILIRKYGLETEFPDEVIREVERLNGDPQRWPVSERIDFTNENIVTIDGETAQDFDDAICVTRLPGGGFRLQVHIADVAWFVAEGSALDREAMGRATSVYFPGRCVPMLPERLSNDLCSLRPDELRLTQGVSIDYDQQGEILRAEFHDGLIRSRARLTYNQVHAAVERRDPELRQQLSHVVAMLDVALELAGVLSRRRTTRGAIDFDLPEPELLFDLRGETAEIIARPRNVAHRLIEEFMLAANEAVASALVRHKQPTLFRVHERPDVGRVHKAAELLAGLGYIVPEPYDQIEPRHLAQLIASARGRAEEPFVARMILRSMALARYDEHCLGHFGLALRHYLHFTSPIRRYPDLVTHRALRRWRHKQAEPASARLERKSRLPDQARECSRLEREAELAERESLAWKRAAYMAQRIGDEFRGTIVEIAKHGMLVLLEEPYVEGLVPLDRLGAERFRLDPHRHVLRSLESGASYKLGQPIDVFVDKVDSVRHLIDFGLVHERRPTAKERQRVERARSKRQVKPRRRRR